MRLVSIRVAARCLLAFSRNFSLQRSRLNRLKTAFNSHFELWKCLSRFTLALRRGKDDGRRTLQIAMKSLRPTAEVSKE